MGVLAEDTEKISQISFVCKEIHDKVDDIYESLMDRDNEEAKEHIKEIIKYLTDLDRSLTEEV
jgi:predicted translin family RNA/ssDNA-binding protein